MRITKTLPKPHQKLLEYLQKITGLDEFILYGGSALDLLQNPEAHVNDYDIAYQKYSATLLEQCTNTVSRSGYNITHPKRHYIINIDTPVLLLYAENIQHKLDIAFLDDFKELGQFNIGTLRWEFPGMVCVDEYNAVQAFRLKTIEPVRGFDKEDAFLIARCFLKLCSKYDLRMTKQEHMEIITVLNNRLQRWKSKTSINNRASAMSAVYTALLSSEKKEVFIKELLHSEILKVIAPKLDKGLRKLSTAELSPKLVSVTNKKDLITKIKASLPEQEEIELSEELRLLEYRHWEKTS